MQAGSVLHLLSGMEPNEAALDSSRRGLPRGAGADSLRAALTAIRETSKAALTEMRSVLGQLRRADRGSPPDEGTGLSRLGALRDAVTAAGAVVTVTTEGEPWPLPPVADHAAYRILQESLTNVLRHAGPGASARSACATSPKLSPSRSPTTAPAPRPGTTATCLATVAMRLTTAPAVTGCAACASGPPRPAVS